MLKPKHRRRAGFALVELVIVILIIGIMAAVAVPRFAESLSRYRVEAAAKRIELDLKLARRQAKISSASRSIQFDEIGHLYVLPGVLHLDHPGQDYRVKLAEAPYAAQIFSVDFGGDAEVIFDGYGLPDSGGTIVVKSGPYQKTITLDGATGEPSIGG
jgi:prepilin-type N-terminal cleavage/methylation domain-containing protein